ncbi:uncharacterized protein LOC116348326 [Contarinia nasturtii]|uniref:uncharacterized protein LOC116348326 n=1 Tax=Contarinia nasturtii TaxID=265458 RepID=UPI0012D465FC|nr:uncharacterized protein LOC116348326 [Contarinia nasturtii]
MSMAAHQNPGASLPAIEKTSEEADTCVLNVDIKTIRSHVKDPKFTSPYTLLEIYATINRISGFGKRSHLNLRSMDNIYAIEAIFFGNILLFQAGNIVRVVGQLVGHQSGQLKILKMSKIDFIKEAALISRLTAISTLEFTKVPK